MLHVNTVLAVCQFKLSKKFLFFTTSFPPIFGQGRFWYLSLTTKNHYAQAKAASFDIHNLVSLMAKEESPLNERLFRRGKVYTYPYEMKN